MRVDLTDELYAKMPNVGRGAVRQILEMAGCIVIESPSTPKDAMRTALRTVRDILSREWDVTGHFSAGDISTMLSDAERRLGL